MRALIIFILAFLASSFCFQAKSQVTAVMQARVEIISGASFTSLQESIIDSDHLFGEVNAGSFSLVTSPGANIDVQVLHTNTIKNKKGEAITFESFQIDHTAMQNGEHRIDLIGKIKDAKKLNGQYSGNLTAVVEYL